MNIQWHEHAKCAGNTHFCEMLERIGNRYRRQAIAEACRGCPVMRECALDCFEFDEDGVPHVREACVPRAGVWITSATRPSSFIHHYLARVAGIDA